ncbi:hypothetical protein MSAN_02533800 [Mycena sanguinolenta]|uniref:Uncharacterized protein n=1 Tax=Mycena sanguinolenta TaxID=230812 RepID=A0A8H6WT87_9AGAR|nr:hypothetical protein MSAN_02533800 [Mycena sanguinolenta]
MADILARLKPRVEEARHPVALVSDEMARQESNTGFKKTSEEHSGRGGATKYVKKASKKQVDKWRSVAEIVLIPDACWEDPDASDAADDVRDLGVAPVPQITRKQQLRDGRLVASRDTRPNKKGAALMFSESWSAEHIFESWLGLLFPHIIEYMEKTHQPLEDGEFYFIPLVAYRGRLKKFVKKDAITGSDLEAITAGKGKGVEQKTLYFGLCFNIPNKIWLKNGWDSPSSDTEYEAKSKKQKKGKGKAQPKPVSTRQSTRKATSKDDDTEIIEVHSDDGIAFPGPASVSRKTMTPDGKKRDDSSQLGTPVKVKLEPGLVSTSIEPDEIPTQISPDSDSDSEFPTPAFLLNRAPSTISASSVSAVASTANGSIAAATSATSSSTTAPIPASDAGAAPPPSPSVSSAVVTPSSLAVPAIPVGPSSPLRPSTSQASRYLGGSVSASTSTAPYTASSSSSLAASFSHTLPFQTPGSRYVAETAAMEDFNNYGNYRENGSKRTFSSAFVEGTGFKSPERPSGNNPWKRARKTT